MNIGIIGEGAIGSYVRAQLPQRGFTLKALLLLPELLEARARDIADVPCVSSVEELPGDIDHMIDCAGHAALDAHGAKILRRGIDLTTVSIGALADSQLYQLLERAAEEGGAKLHLVSGAIGALDCLRAAGVGRLHRVTYTGRKPPAGWRGSPAETCLDLDKLDRGPEVHFQGSARDAATKYPKNANVAAAVALAGLGFDDTEVKLVADPGISENIHEVDASGEFGRFTFAVRGNALADNPRSSALAAMSVISKLEQESRCISF